MIPIIGVIGWHRSGKTTFIVGLIQALKARGLQVAAIKHTSEEPAIDRPGTDTDLFARAGCRFVAIAGPHGSAILLPQPPEPSFWELVAQVPSGVDLIIVEGYRRLALPRFEVLTEGHPSIPREQLIAVVRRSQAVQVGAGLFVLEAEDYAGAVERLYAAGILPPPRVAAEG